MPPRGDRAGDLVVFRPAEHPPCEADDAGLHCGDGGERRRVEAVDRLHEPRGIGCELVEFGEAGVVHVREHPAPVRRCVGSAQRLEFGEDLRCLTTKSVHHATVSAVGATASASISPRRSGYLRSATRLAATSSAGITLKLIAMPAIAAGDWVTVWEPVDSA